MVVGLKQSEKSKPMIEINGLKFMYPGIDGHPLLGSTPLIEDFSLSTLVIAASLLDPMALVRSIVSSFILCFSFSLILLFVWFPRKWRDRKIKIENCDINVLIFGFNYNGVRSIFVLFHIQSFFESLFTCQEN